MLRWPLVLCALLLLEFAVANAANNKREKLLEYAEENYVEFLKYGNKEIRTLFQNVLTDPKETEGFGDQVKLYEDFLERSKVYETAALELLIQIFMEGIHLMAIKESIQTQNWAKQLVFKKYDDLVAVEKNLALRLVQSTQRFSYQVREYLENLSPEEKKLEAGMIYWYGCFTYERNLEGRVEMMNEIFELYKNPKKITEIYEERVWNSFKNFVDGAKKIVDGVHEESYVNDIQNIKELFTSTEIFEGANELFKQLQTFYSDFDKWLRDMGPSFYKSEEDLSKLAIELIDEINYYTKRYIKYAEDDTKTTIQEWYENLRKAENFEEIFTQHFELPKTLMKQKYKPPLVE